MALLAARNTDGVGSRNISNDTWHYCDSDTVDTTGTVATTKIHGVALLAIGTGNILLRLQKYTDSAWSTIGTGSTSAANFPQLGEDPADWVTITISETPSIVAADTIRIGLYLQTLTGTPVFWWTNQDNIGGNPGTELYEVHGTELSTPTKATNPTPSDTNADVTLDQATITWEDGGGADTYNVYYGTTSGDLGDAVSSAQAGASFTVTDITNGSPYDYLTTRYWRIDSTNNVGTTTGDEWSFTTIRAQSPKVTYLYNNEYYQLLIQDGGTYGDHPADGGVEDTDYVVVTYEPNFIRSNIKLISAANNSIWFEDTI